ncbi:MAG TPA: SMP-30/gluconolactonase/LRE family protein [Pirellulales bacterium]|jgi:gluconolactonase|nr:SMP-30/gluconolactonase/LRE family protein [Pirellulales bacterium]
MFDVGLPTQLVPPDTKARTAASVSFLEGPAWHPSGDLYFSDIAGNRILKMAADGTVSVFRADSGRTNGNTFDALGRLISCEGAEFGTGGRRRVVRTDVTTGQVEVLTERFEGKRYNAPNDVVVDTRGRIWFTDPYYWTDQQSLEMGCEAVYCIEGAQVRRVVSQPAIGRPNGLAITPDDRTLYVIDSHNVAGGNRKIWAFDVSDEGTLGGQRLVFDFGTGRGGDGMRLDRQGNLWVAAGVLKPRNPHETDAVKTGVHVISPAGKLLGRIPIPEDVITNLTFAGADFKTLFVTAGKTVFKIETSVSGYSLFPPLDSKARD